MGKQKKRTYSSEQLSLLERIFDRMASGDDINDPSDELAYIVNQLLNLKNERAKRQRADRQTATEPKADPYTPPVSADRLSETEEDY